MTLPAAAFSAALILLTAVGSSCGASGTLEAAGTVQPERAAAGLTEDALEALGLPAEGLSPREIRLAQQLWAERLGWGWPRGIADVSVHSESAAIEYERAVPLMAPAFAAVGINLSYESRIQDFQRGFFARVKYKVDERRLSADVLNALALGATQEAASLRTSIQASSQSSGELYRWLRSERDWLDYELFVDGRVSSLLAEDGISVSVIALFETGSGKYAKLSWRRPR